MKTSNRKILQLINHGFSGNLLSDLNEGQINALHKRLVESKKTLKKKLKLLPPNWIKITNKTWQN